MSADAGKASLWKTLQARGFFQQCTDPSLLAEEPTERPTAKPVSGYIGFDPTAASFHVGHLLPLMALLHMRLSGHRPIALLGVGTAMIGDPTGKNRMRPILSAAALEENAAALEKQVRALLCSSATAPSPETTSAEADAGAEAGGTVLVANNADWLCGLDYLQFLREVGRHFSVNRMLGFETFKERLKSGLNFIELNYPLLQAYDFLELHRRHGCEIQFGGDDQWANILGGVHLIRRMDGTRVHGWTFPLLTTADGKKMGKTESGAVWLAPQRTSPYDYYQYWVNIDDADAEACLKRFTLLSLEEIAALTAEKGAALREAKHRLAYETTSILHGGDEAQRAQRGSQRLFGSAATSKEGPAGSVESDAAIPTVSISPALCHPAEGLSAPALLTALSLATSRSAARRLIEQRAVSIDGVLVPSVDHLIQPSALTDGVLVQVGKKRFKRAILADAD